MNLPVGEFRFAGLALRVLGAAFVVLAVTTALVYVVPGAVAKLVVALGGVVVMIALMAFISTRYVDRTLPGDKD